MGSDSRVGSLMCEGKQLVPVLVPVLEHTVVDAAEQPRQTKTGGDGENRDQVLEYL